MMQRRKLMIGAAALLATGMTLGLHVFSRKRYAPTPYDDVLGYLRDREWAQKFGTQAMTPDFKPDTAAARLRSLLGSGDLESAALRDAAQGRLSEPAQWLVPESVALLAMLAAKAAPRE
jgi:hypothetical protein